MQRVTFLPELSDDDIIELQAEDEDLGPVVRWLTDGKIPTYDELGSFL